jgi:hypothetical protein
MRSRAPESPSRLHLDLSSLEGLAWDGVEVSARHAVEQAEAQVLVTVEAAEGSARMVLSRSDAGRLIEELQAAVRDYDFGVAHGDRPAGS